MNDMLSNPSIVMETLRKIPHNIIFCKVRGVVSLKQQAVRNDTGNSLGLSECAKYYDII